MGEDKQEPTAPPMVPPPPYSEIYNDAYAHQTVLAPPPYTPGADYPAAAAATQPEPIPYSNPYPNTASHGGGIPYSTPASGGIPYSTPTRDAQPQFRGRTFIMRDNDDEFRTAQQSISWILCLSWVSCLFFCWPIGIIALISSYRGEQELQRGNVEQGMTLSARAKKLAFLSILTGVMMYAISGLIRYYNNK